MTTRTSGLLLAIAAVLVMANTEAAETPHVVFTDASFVSVAAGIGGFQQQAFGTLPGERPQNTQTVIYSGNEVITDAEYSALRYVRSFNPSILTLPQGQFCVGFSIPGFAQGWTGSLAVVAKYSIGRVMFEIP